MYRQQASLYKQQEIRTASPGKIIVMLYDGALKNLHIAENAYQEEDYEQKSNALTKVVDIVSELMNSLDLDKGGEIANRLQSLYVYVLQRVLDADMKKDLDALQESRKILSELREAFASISKSSEIAAM